MDEPKSLDSLFKEKILRIPDYQRGYAWQRGQLKDFWEDLINLSSGRSHYTGVITLKEIEKRKIQETDNEYWLVDEDSYKVYHIVDGQQRLTTFVIFVQAFLDLYKSVPGTQNLADDKIFVSENLTVAAVQDKFLFKRKPSGSQYRTYKFGYTADNPSDEYLRYRILNEQGAGHLQETFYTLNLSNAKIYLLQQLQDYKAREGAQAVTNLYKKLTKQFLFNEYIIRDEFDVFVAFETINNRGKRLSDLELLKNRLIYLTTLFKEQDFAPADRDYLRDTVNKGWKEVYYQLGRNKERPLNDDDFLRAHWTMYFQYSRQTGKDYIRFLLEEKFAPKNIYKVVEENVSLLTAEEQTTADDFNNLENDTAEENEAELKVSAELRPTDLGDFVSSLKESACHWFNSFNPDKAQELSQAEGAWLVRLNRIGMVYFRPLVMAVLKNEKNEGKRIEIFRKMERFIFIAFRLTPARANYRSSEFYNAARYLDRGEIDADDILKKLDDGLSYVMDKNGTLKIAEFYDLITKKFTVGSGYYGWSGLRYFLYEYELSLLSESRQPKVEWNELLKTEKGQSIYRAHLSPNRDDRMGEPLRWLER